MSWDQFPDAVLERVLLAAVSSPADVPRLRSLERRARHLGVTSAWVEAAAIAQLGAGVCATLRCSHGGSDFDWLVALRSASEGRLRCSAFPQNRNATAERSGHSSIVLRGELLIVFAGVKCQAPGQDEVPEGHEDPETRRPSSAAVAEFAALDLTCGQWLGVMDCGNTEPLPRLRSSLTPLGFASATLVGGQTFEGPGTGSPFNDVWRLQCEPVKKGIMTYHWKELTNELGGRPMEARSCHTAVQTPCGLLFFGGVGKSGHVLPCDAYCLRDSTWTLPSQSGLLPQQGALHHGMYHCDHVVLAGGVDDAGLQRRGLGRPTEVHTLNLTTWVWERLARHPLTPPLHSRAAMMAFGNCILIVGGDSGARMGSSNYVASLNLDEVVKPASPSCAAGKQAVWKTGVVTGVEFAAAGHTVTGGILIGGLGRQDLAAPAAFLVPDVKPRAPEAAAVKKQAKAPRWFKK